MIYGSHILALGLSLVALLVSTQFGFAYTRAKFLGIAITLVIINFWVLQKKLNFFIPLSKQITRSFLLCFLCLLIALGFSKVGEPVTGLSLILLWALMAFAVSAVAKAEGTEEFLKRLITFQIPFYILIYAVLLHHEIYIKSNVRPFFGNPNITSNFIAISLLQILFFISFQKKRALKILASLLLPIGLFLILSLGGRAPFLGLLVGSGVYLSLTHLDNLKKLLHNHKTLLIVAAFVIICVIAAFFFKKGITSLEYRYSFWRNTLCLIADNPLGVGPGSYEYIFQHYNGKCYPAAESIEGRLIRNPHNMFLEFAAELGPLGAFAFFAFFFFIFREIKTKLSQFPLEASWVLSLTALLATLGFFEFPQDTPYTLFVISILCGVALSLVNSKINARSAFIRLLNFSAAFVVAVIFFTKAYSDHLTLMPGPNKHESYKLACALNNESWRSCVFLGLSYIERGEYEYAEAVIQALTKRFDEHHSLLHLKGTYADKLGDTKTACEEFRKYHLLFDQKTSKKDYLEKNCK